MEKSRPSRGQVVLLVTVVLVLSFALGLAFDRPADPEAVAAFLAANAQILLDARQAIRADCRVEVEYHESFFARHTDSFTPLRHLAQCFGLELEAARDRGAFTQAMRPTAPAGADSWWTSWYRPGSRASASTTCAGYVTS